ncbi:hypothetical protein K439DRAFT_995481 [Ramaria rubella]|nr:hypothetical protein K439DRAFT_995481 [Ramaria rubella]
MPSLIDTLDRFNYTSSAIRSLTLSQSPCTDPGPFTGAILDLTLNDLLREADDAEYGLFTFVKESSDSPTDGTAAHGKVGRRGFRGATPLRTKRVAGTTKEEEPEVYVEAASKYLDRFHAVKPMPHLRTELESLVDRLNHVRDSLDRLQESLEQTGQTGRVSPKSQILEEERRISELKSRILQLRKRKEAIAFKPPATSKLRTKPGTRPPQAKSKNLSPSGCFDSPSSTFSTPTTRTTKPKAKPHAVANDKPRSRMPGPPSGKSIPQDLEHPNPGITTHEEREEELFWSGKKPPRSVDQSESLLDEEIDMAGMDALMSPPPVMPNSSPPMRRQRTATHSSAYEPSIDEERQEEEGSDEDTGEPTIVISKLRSLTSAAPVTTSPVPPPSPPPSRPESWTSAVAEPQTPIQHGQDAVENTAPPSTKSKIRRVRITTETERACTKIWNTIPDLLVPGNNFTLPGKHPPSAKDTLMVLQAIAAQPIPDPSSPGSSPSSRSTLSSLLGIETLPASSTPHQIMTAHVLLSLLTAPSHGMPLTALKTLLASKTAVPSPGPEAGRQAKQTAAVMGASAAQAGTRALYGCVAKKLVKIDRGGGEQIVRFD